MAEINVNTSHLHQCTRSKSGGTLSGSVRRIVSMQNCPAACVNCRENNTNLNDARVRGTEVGSGTSYQMTGEISVNPNHNHSEYLYRSSYDYTARELTYPYSCSQGHSNCRNSTITGQDVIKTLTSLQAIPTTFSQDTGEIEIYRDHNHQADDITGVTGYFQWGAACGLSHTVCKKGAQHTLLSPNLAAITLNNARY